LAKPPARRVKWPSWPTKLLAKRVTKFDELRSHFTCREKRLTRRTGRIVAHGGRLFE
jgi:hypothetical protein